MCSVLANDQPAQLSALYAEMEPSNLAPLWEVLSGLVTPHPAGPARTHRWSYPEAREFLLRAGDLISAEQAERRVLILENPGFPGLSAVSLSLYAGLQLILPGEVAPCHRHSQSALRFVLEGDGAHTAVDGEKAIMRPFDLVLTPGGQWHDHGNGTSGPMIWLDGLDIPTVRHFDASFAEKLGKSEHPETAPPDSSLELYGRNLRPLAGSTADRRPAHQPLFHYPYSDWRPALAAMAASAPMDPHLGHALEFTNPADGGSIMPTIAAHVRLVPGGVTTRARRTTESLVLVAVEGTGRIRVDEEVIEVSDRDITVVPSWKSLAVEASEDLVLFGFSDSAAQRKLGLYREESL